MFSIIVLSRSEKMSNTTKSSLAASLKKLLEYKTLDRITISDITNNCGINRQTFYYHFDDLAGLVEWMFNDKISCIMRDLKLPDEWRKGLLMILQVLQENDSFVIQIYHSKINDRMYRFMFETCLSFITEVSDADMRKGIQHKKFSVSQEPGLSNLILSRDKIEDSKMLFYKYIKTTRMENVFVLPSGEKTFDSSELLASNKIKKIINVLRENFDIVIFDSTPSMLLTDGIILSRLVETNIIVSEYEKTKIKDLRKTKELIEDVGGDVAGIIINKINKGKKKYYYYESNKYSKH